MCAYEKSFLLTILVFLTIGVVLSEEDGVDIKKVKWRKPWKREPPPPTTQEVDDVQCFCNLPKCVTTGYMCKSKAGGCYTELGSPRQPKNPFLSSYRGIHGCLEPESETSQQPRCQNQNGNSGDNAKMVATRSGDGEQPLLFCCYRDMCNYAENVQQPKDIFNDTMLADIVRDPSSRPQQKAQSQEEDTFLCSSSEVWFRAATIAVPICGIVILFVLVMCAYKILKNENRDAFNQKLGPEMYVQQVSPRNPRGKAFTHFEGQYDNLLGKCFLPPQHQYSNDNMDYCNRYQLPLIGQKTLNDTNKNVKSSIYLDIGKDSPECSNVNIASEHHKFSNSDCVGVHKGF